VNDVLGAAAWTTEVMANSASVASVMTNDLRFMIAAPIRPNKEQDHLPTPERAIAGHPSPSRDYFRLEVGLWLPCRSEPMLAA
jgi:hypothetical protein